MPSLSVAIMIRSIRRQGSCDIWLPLNLGHLLGSGPITNPQGGVFTSSQRRAPLVQGWAEPRVSTGRWWDCAGSVGWHPNAAWLHKYDATIQKCHWLSKADVSPSPRAIAKPGRAETSHTCRLIRWGWWMEQACTGDRTESGPLISQKQKGRPLVDGRP